jgi:flagellar protein FlgJ
VSVSALGNLPVTESFATSDGGSNRARLSSAAKEFESVLLGQWLKDAESTFGSVPGSEEDDAGGEQMKDFAMQHVATEITDRGGIGIAPMVERALAKEESQKVSQSGGDGR